ncbi:hypothetical protein RchiOBHm_Chr1g0378411 [Rosa chinensis]|uniref:Uncharacterized protein n=1 Tax=Rosa chinensis TaxID=74649 RepID=A0A2P6SNE6_ROSCH|nr:hypothetical protein RchiOBHm_Chr1g0378411 [Rosa chinensis]
MGGTNGDRPHPPPRLEGGSRFGNCNRYRGSSGQFGCDKAGAPSLYTSSPISE